MNTSYSTLLQDKTHYVDRNGSETVAYVPIEEIKSLIARLLEITTGIGAYQSEYLRLRDRRYARYLLRSAEHMASIGARKVAITAEDYEWLKATAKDAGHGE